MFTYIFVYRWNACYPDPSLKRTHSSYSEHKPIHIYMFIFVCVYICLGRTHDVTNPLQRALVVDIRSHGYTYINTHLYVYKWNACCRKASLTRTHH